MKALKRIRKQKGLTQAELAEICGIDPKLLSRYERGERTPKLPLLKLLSVVLDCTVDDLLTDVNINK